MTDDVGLDAFTNLTCGKEGNATAHKLKPCISQLKTKSKTPTFAKVLDCFRIYLYNNIVPIC